MGKFNRKNLFIKMLEKLCSFKILMVCFFLIFIFFVYGFILLPQISLVGGKVVFVNYKEEYVEKGFNAAFLGKNLNKKVKIEGNVDSKKLGKYSIVYSVGDGLFKRKITRVVIVKDMSAPAIKLESYDDIYVCPGNTYKGDKYSAFDNLDGDVTDKVKVVKKNDKITYKVKDKSGNKSEVSRKIIYEDIVPPEIKLNGGDIVYTFINENYEDGGYTAIDNCSSDITKNVNVNSEVDISKLGEYNIIYSVKDGAGNNTMKIRKVVVSERDVPGVVYLTFDDGPRSGTTDVILDILKEEGVKATFFVTNSGPDELIKRAYDEGHSIALHTSSHDYATIYSSVDNYFNDLSVVSDRVKRITGSETKIIRFPGGGSNTVSRRYSEGIMTTLTGEVINRGFKYYDWNISSGDAESGKHTAEEIRDNVISRLSKDKVNMVLMHDIKPYTRDALREIIKYGKDNGYVFDKITMNTEMITQRVNN